MIEVLASATVVPYSNVWIHQANTLYALNLYNVRYQLNHSK